MDAKQHSELMARRSRDKYSAESEIGEIPPVCFPTASREVFDKWTADRLARLVDDPEQLERIIERQYPRTTGAAVNELRWRGFDATEERAEHFAKELGVETFGGALAWFKDDIDELADILRGRNMLMIGTRHRMMRGISWEADHAA